MNLMAAALFNMSVLTRTRTDPSLIQGIYTGKSKDFFFFFNSDSVQGWYFWLRC